MNEISKIIINMKKMMFTHCMGCFQPLTQKRCFNPDCQMKPEEFHIDYY